jgi:hypothetical protein
MLKKLSEDVHPQEVAIGLYFMTPKHRADPANHCVPVEDVLKIPDVKDGTIIVMPLLRQYNDPPLETFSEAIDFFRQIFEVRSILADLTILIMIWLGLAVYAFSEYRP